MGSLDLETDEAIAQGKRLVAGKPWPESARFDVNPRTSNEEEVFLRVAFEQGHVESQEHAVGLLRHLREAGLSITLIPPACHEAEEHEPHRVAWPDGNGDMQPWRCGGEPNQKLRPPVSVMAMLAGRT